MDPDEQWGERAIIHVDMDAFFASVEQLDHPEWRGRPVIVGGSADGRGVVATASYEARAFGVHSAMPSAQARRLCPDAVWAPARFPRYRDLSGQVFDIFGSFTPYVLPVSIDEAFLDVTPGSVFRTDPVTIASDIRSAVDGIGLSCSVGLSTSRTVAKVASDHDKPHGLTVVPSGSEAGFLAPLPLRALTGIGPATASALRSAGIRTLGELAALDHTSARQLLGSGGPDLALRAAGIDERPIAEHADTKSVSAEHTFAVDVHEQAEVEAVLRRQVEHVASRLRHAGLSGRTITVKLRYADFTTRTASRTIPAATDLARELTPVAFDLLRETWTAGAGLRLLGFGVSGFAESMRQLDLFGNDLSAHHAKARALTQSVDEVRRRFGQGAVGFGVPRRDADEKKG